MKGLWVKYLKEAILQILYYHISIYVDSFQWIYIFQNFYNSGSSEELETNGEDLSRTKRDFDENQQLFRNKRLTTRRVGDVDVVVQGTLVLI